MWSNLIIESFIVALAVFALTVIIKMAIIKYKNNDEIKKISKETYIKIFLQATFWAYMSAVLNITIIRSEKTEFSYNLLPFKSIETLIENFVCAPTLGIELDFIIGNILMFFPFGFVLVLLDEKYNSLVRVIKYALITILCVETLQIITLRGSFDIDDVIYNLIGSILGYALIQVIKSIMGKDIRRIIVSVIPYIVIFIGIIVCKVVYASMPYGFDVGFHIYDAKENPIEADMELDDTYYNEYVYKEIYSELNEENVINIADKIFEFLNKEYEKEETENRGYSYVSKDNLYRLIVTGNNGFELYNISNYEKYEEENQSNKVLVEKLEYDRTNTKNIIDYVYKLLESAGCDVTDRGYLSITETYPSIRYSFKGIDKEGQKEVKRVDVSVTSSGEIAKISCINFLYEKTDDEIKLISLKEAYDDLKYGRTGIEIDEKQTIISAELRWSNQTSKGYNLPVYVFSGLPENKDKNEIDYYYVPAWEFE